MFRVKYIAKCGVQIAGMIFKQAPELSGRQEVVSCRTGAAGTV
ncbi:MAG: DUF6783 domain-containing protein [Ruminococcus sp.]